MHSDVVGSSPAAAPLTETSGETADNPMPRYPDLPPIPDEATRKREEFRMLLTGFATGLTVAGIFLLYVVLDYAKFLP